MSGLHPTLLVAPELGFAALRTLLGAHGFRLDGQSADPLIDGEPEWALFEREADACRIHYGFNPVATLRRLEFRGQAAAVACARLAQVLPGIDVARARSFLLSRNPRDQWLGILVAGELRDARLRPMVAALAEGDEPRTAAAARAALASLAEPEPALFDAWQRLLAEQQREPSRNVLFRHLPDVELKRQVLRWTGREPPSDRAGSEHLLRTALEDADAEVRVTAMLVAARLHLRSLALAVRDASLPEDRSAGAPPGDRLYYRRLQRLAAAYLATPDDAALEGVAARRRTSFEAALRGQQPVNSDETLLWHALVTPLDLGRPPPRLPAGVMQTDAGFELAVAGRKLRLCWVDAVPHWLGGLAGAGPPARVRQQAPANGFFISELPLSAALVGGLMVPTAGAQAPSDEEPWSGSVEDANRVLRALHSACGLPVRMPSPDEWEMAARGPDGRFHPWGAGLQAGWREAVSPWGVGGWGREEWARDAGSNGSVAVVGGRKPLPVATRGDSAAVAVATVRAVIAPG